MTNHSNYFKNMNAYHQISQELKNLNLIIRTFEKRQNVVEDFGSKITRLKTMAKEKKQELKQLPKVR